MTDVLASHEVDPGQLEAVSDHVHLPEPRFSEEDILFVECARRKADQINSRRTTEHDVGWGTGLRTEEAQ